ncbi:MAG: hypothetical protein QME78_00235 [Thermodesulfobacteriota bacterium]|nr:hypothetical protein [Thermodesulfobacteriota bacterium]
MIQVLYRLLVACQQLKSLIIMFDMETLIPAEMKLAEDAIQDAEKILANPVQIEGNVLAAHQEYRELKKAHRELLDRAHVAGIWGPWAGGWEGSYDQRYWGEE